MATWLHDPTALRSVAEGPEGAARDWANLRLALRDPAELRHLPTRPWDRMLAIAVRGRGAVDAVLELVRARAEGAVDALDAVCALGALPVEGAPWVEALREWFPALPPDDRATVARALADLGALDREILSLAARDDGADPALVPSLVMRWAASEGLALDPVAAELAGPLARAERDRPGLLPWTLAALGVPHLVVDGADPAVAALAGARLAGAERPLPSSPKGSVRSRTRRVVLGLLDGRSGPAEALLRALVDHEGPPSASLAAWAGWCASRPDPADAVQAVVEGAGEDRPLLCAADRALSDPTVLVGPLRDPLLGSTPLVGLGTARVITRGSEALRDALLVRAELSREVDASAELGAFAAAASDPDRVVDWLSSPESRDLGLSCARFAPTVEVLSALLELPVPLDRGAHTAWAWALAEMADPAAHAALEAAEGVPADARAHAAELLGR